MYKPILSSLVIPPSSGAECYNEIQRSQGTIPCAWWAQSHSCSSCQLAEEMLQEQVIFSFSTDFYTVFVIIYAREMKLLGSCIPPLVVQHSLKKYKVDFYVIQVQIFRDKNIKITIRGKKKAFTASGSYRAAGEPQPDQALGIR